MQPVFFCIAGCLNIGWMGSGKGSTAEVKKNKTNDNVTQENMDGTKMSLD